MGTLAAGSSVLKGLAPSTTWALELNALSPNVGQILLKVARHIFPHETLDDAVYALVVKDLDVAAADDEVLAGMLAEGAADLNKLAKETGSPPAPNGRPSSWLRCRIRFLSRKSAARQSCRFTTMIWHGALWIRRTFLAKRGISEPGFKICSGCPTPQQKRARSPPNGD